MSRVLARRGLEDQLALEAIMRLKLRREAAHAEPPWNVLEDKPYQPSPRQQAFHQASERYKLYGGAVGGSPWFPSGVLDRDPASAAPTDRRTLQGAGDAYVAGTWAGDWGDVTLITDLVDHRQHYLTLNDVDDHARQQVRRGAPGPRG